MINKKMRYNPNSTVIKPVNKSIFILVMFVNSIRGVEACSKVSESGAVCKQVDEYGQTPRSVTPRGT